MLALVLLPLLQPAPVRAPSPPPEERVHLMLCVVYDKPKPTAAEQAEVGAVL